MGSEDPKLTIITIAFIVVMAVLIWYFGGGPKDYAKNKLVWEKINTGKTKKEINKRVIGELLIFIGLAGLAMGSITAGSGPSKYVILGSLFSLLGGGALNKRMKRIKTLSDEAKKNKTNDFNPEDLYTDQ